MPVIYDCENCGHPVHKGSIEKVTVPEIRGFFGVKQSEETEVNYSPT